MELLAAVWLYVPAGLANMAPVIAKNIPVLKRFTQPLDMNKTFHGKRVFGSHKTLRGLLAAIIVGMSAGFLQVAFYNVFAWPSTNITPLDYSSLNVALVGGVLGFGAIFGDAVKSFFKRQVNIPPGKNWFLFDQVDYVIGAILVSLPFFQLPIAQYVFITLVGILLHPIINVISWLLRLQDKPL